MHKKIPTNKELKLWGIKNTNTCAYCNEIDDIQHTLYACPLIMSLWIKWSEYISQRYGIVIDVTFEMIILNNFVSDPKNIVNVLGLVLKQLIYRCKCRKTKVDFTMFINESKLHVHSEYIHAKQNNKVGYHQEKWGENTQNNDLNEYILVHILSM